MRLLGIIVVVFIILHWNFVSMNATAMRFHAGMSHVKLFNFRNFLQWEKSVQVVANCLLIKCAIILICLYAPSHIWSTRKIRKKITLLIMKRSVENYTGTAIFPNVCVFLISCHSLHVCQICWFFRLLFCNHKRSLLWDVCKRQADRWTGKLA